VDISTPFVKMYSTEWCHDCKAMLTFFEEKDVPYTVISVDTDPVAIERLKKICGGKKIVPTLEIEGKAYINPSVDYIMSIVNHDRDNNI
jgi:glutaredoxin